MFRRRILLKLLGWLLDNAKKANSFKHYFVYNACFRSILCIIAIYEKINHNQIQTYVNIKITRK